MKRILLLEDELAVSLAAVIALEDAGYQVDTVTTATDAIAAFKSDHYDLVITDMMIRRRGRSIPDGGINLINFIRSSSQADPVTRRVPILGISGMTRNQGLGNILKIAMSLGASDYLEKPFTDEDLLAKVEELLKASEANRAQRVNPGNQRSA